MKQWIIWQNLRQQPKLILYIYSFSSSYAIAWQGELLQYWQFTTANRRIKLKHLYHRIQTSRATRKAAVVQNCNIFELIFGYYLLSGFILVDILP